MDLKRVLCQPDPWTLLRGPSAFTAPSYFPNEHKGGEVALLSPGMNALHQLVKWEQSTSMTRRQHYARLLQSCTALGRLHFGALLDQGEVALELTGESPSVQAGLLAVAAARQDPGAKKLPSEGHTFTLAVRWRDVLQFALSKFNAVDTGLKASDRELVTLAAATEPGPSTASPPPRIVIVAYSRSSVVVSAAPRESFESVPNRTAVAARLLIATLLPTPATSPSAPPRWVCPLHAPTTAAVPLLSISTATATTLTESSRHTIDALPPIRVGACGY